MARKWWTLVAVCTGVFMLLLDVTIVNVALPDIQHAFDASLVRPAVGDRRLRAHARRAAADRGLDRRPLRPPARVRDRHRRVHARLAAVRPRAGDPTVPRARPRVQGVGGAIMFATSLALLSTRSAGRDRGVAFGVFGAVTGVAVAVGPVLGGAITSGLSWRWIFFVNIPIGIVALVVTLRARATSRATRTRARPDWLGFVTFSAGLAALVFGLIRGNADGLGLDHGASARSPPSAVLLAALRGRRAALQREPMFDLSLLRVPTFVGGLVAAFAISGSLFSLLTYLVLYLQNVLGYSAIETGVRFLAAHRRDLPHRRRRRAADGEGPDAAADRAGLRARSASACC